MRGKEDGPSPQAETFLDLDSIGFLAEEGAQNSKSVGVPVSQRAMSVACLPSPMNGRWQGGEIN